MKYFNKIYTSSLLYLAVVLSTFTKGDVSKQEIPKIHVNKYELYIQTTEDDFRDSDESLRFEGNVKIYFDLVKPVYNLTFAVNIVPETNIHEAKIFGFSNTTWNQLNEYEFTQTDKHLNFSFTNNFNQSYAKYRLSINFTNPYRNDMSGFYRSSYVGKDGKKRWLLTTHFEPNFARRAFPCFDIPSVKASFEITLAYPKTMRDYSVLCNTPIKTINQRNNFVIVECWETVYMMSSYLVAFTISDFVPTASVEFVSDTPIYSKRNITTYGRKDIIDKGDGNLSLYVAQDAVTLLSTYLEKGYGFEKIDQVGIPDFSAGAMENWGHISFRERALFFNEKTSTATKQSNVLTITHELVHQWFGNLVTLASWDYIWLNEAFATYISYVIANKIQCVDAMNWDYLKQFLVSEMHMRAFETDGLVGSRQLSYVSDDEDLIAAAFNDIPYSKGASILRMWDLSLKKDKFRQSLVDYIELNAESSVVPSDLYDSLDIIANMRVDFFNSWHEKPGYPVVNVKKNGTIYTLSQTRFLWEKVYNAKRHVYVVPITLTDADSLNFTTFAILWLRNDTLELNITSKWFIINNQQAGYYRVNYNPENWEALTEALKEKDHSKIHELNRAQIINDVFSLARSLQDDYVDYITALNLASYLKNEESYVVWKSALHGFDFLLSKLHRDEIVFNKFKDFVLSLIQNQYRDLNCTTLNHIQKLKTALLARWACSLNYEPCVTSALKLYESASLLPDTEEIILCTNVRNNNTAWNEVYEMYKYEMDSSRKTMYLNVLGCTNDKTVAADYLNRTLKRDSMIRSQDCVFALASVYNGNLQNVEVALKFIEENFEIISTEFGGINPLGKALAGISAKLYSNEDIKRMEALAKRIKESTTVLVPMESVDNALSVAKGNKQWITERANQLHNFLNSGSTLSFSIVVLALCSVLIYQF